MEDITKRVAALSDKELSNLGKAISNELREREKASAAEKIEQHEDYVGKCYKKRNHDQFEYIKILDAKSVNEHWVTAAILRPWEDIVLKSPIDVHVQGENADLGGFAIEDIPLFCQNSALLNELIETTPDVLSLEKRFGKGNLQIRSDNMVGILCGVYILVLLLWRQWMS